jgi:hypothetical protein
MTDESDRAWRENLEALGQWLDALTTKDAAAIAKAQARMDDTADAYLATRGIRQR